MSTPLTDRIQALTAQANATTGGSDATLADAVGTLIAGYGQGGDALWKSEKLAVNHIGTARHPQFWMSYFGIADQDVLDGNVFMMVFSDNTIDTSYAYIILLYPTSDGAEVGATTIRSGGTTVTYGLTRYAYAVAGTTIDVYRIEGAL